MLLLSLCYMPCIARPPTLCAEHYMHTIYPVWLSRGAIWSIRVWLGLACFVTV